MEKNILIEMLSSKDIRISVNNEETVVIKHEKREINANDVYNLLNYSSGDRYTIESKNPENLDNSVLDFFVGLINEIVSSLNDRNSD